MSNVTIDELISEFRRLGVTGDGDNGKTAIEWSLEWRCGQDKARRLLHQAKGAGILQVGLAQREGLDGICRPTRVYAIQFDVPTRKKK